MKTTTVVFRFGEEKRREEKRNRTKNHEKVSDDDFMCLFFWRYSSRIGD